MRRRRIGVNEMQFIRVLFLLFLFRFAESCESLIEREWSAGGRDWRGFLSDDPSDKISCCPKAAITDVLIG